MNNLIEYTIDVTLDFITSGYLNYLLILLAIAAAFNLVYILTGRSSGRRKQ